MSLPAYVIEVREGHRFDEDKLRSYLSGRLDGFEGPLRVHQFKGGQSNPTYLLSTEDRRWVLRKKPGGKLLPSAHMVDREFRVINALKDSDVPVPQAYLLCEDPEIMGTTFYVMDYLPGRIFQSPELPGVSVQDRGKMYDDMAKTLAALHRVKVDSVGLSDFGKADGYVARQLRRWSKQYEATATQTVPAMDALMAWLPEHLPVDDECTIAHGDFRPGNLLFHPTRPEVIGVLDWELSTLGHPLSDLAYFCLAYHLPNMSKELTGLAGTDIEALGIPLQSDFVRLYSKYAGRPAPENLSYFLAFSLFRLAAIVQGVYKRSLQGNASDAKASAYGAAAGLLAGLGWQIAQE